MIAKFMIGCLMQFIVIGLVIVFYNLFHDWGIQ